ncbi:hypothetical protein RHGRI_022152 [Rhododendron griersonianum]|uniref:GDSL esterase/lipase n=1 Tax=Rhododendron griersonianum TaxID=479676 RepID=A0AAV6JQX0_9ERIC|nr:hypothetical protein RHGRI_022152 [Rhododendron griersonianum]
MVEKKNKSSRKSDAVGSSKENDDATSKEYSKNAEKVSWRQFLFTILGITAAVVIGICFRNSIRGPAKSMDPLFGSSVPVMYVFGDSTVAAGDFLMTPFPYGIDWPNGVTKNESKGRFCNGYTVADLLAKRLNIPIPQSYNFLDNKRVKLEGNGNNFASAGCGLLQATRPFVGFECYSISDQILQMLYGPKKWDAKARFDEAIYVISVGGNDLMFSLKGKDPRVFARQLGSEMGNLLKTLYEKVGGRTYFVNNVGPLGCIPNNREFSGLEKKCNQELNVAAVEYNRVLDEVLLNFSRISDDSTVVVLADSFKLFSLFLESPAVLGFSNATGPCCGEWVDSKGMFVCNGTSPLCSKSEREGYIFFDGAHTTASANQKFLEFCLARKICSVVGKLL